MREVALLLAYPWIPQLRGSLVHRDRHINPVMRRFLDLMHANTLT